MPDEIEVVATSVLVDWGGQRLAGPGTLRLTGEEFVVLDARGGTVSATYGELRGGAWRAGTIVVHGEGGMAAVEAKQGLDQAWVRLIARVCPVPELARGHRLLGSRRGGSVDAQSRFLAPLLQARKRLEQQADLDARVAAIEAKDLRERIASALQTIARETFPSSHPDRRGLEAELEESMAVLFAGLDAMEAAAKDFRSAPEAIRFMAWRAWVATVADTFALADSSWAIASRLLPAGKP